MDLRSILRSTWGLRSLIAGTFPRSCRLCGRVYQTIDDFLLCTQPPVDVPGISKKQDWGRLPFLEVFRRCECGSGLMEPCEDRRDGTRRGGTKREQFTELLELLHRADVSAADALSELRKLMRGEDAPILREKGLI